MNHFTSILTDCRGLDKRVVTARHMLHYCPSAIVLVNLRFHYAHYKSYLLRIIAFQLLTIKSFTYGFQKTLPPQKAQKVL